MGQARLPNVWLEGPFDAKVSSKEQALGIATAAVFFNMNPNYILALSTKETKLNCFPATNGKDGCYQIEAGTAWAQLLQNYGTTHFRSVTHQNTTQHWGRGAMTVGFYNQITQALFNGFGYRFPEFASQSVDREAKTKILNYTYNRGQWNEPTRQIMLEGGRRTQCAGTLDVLSCYPNSQPGAPFDWGIDHTRSVVSYCEAFEKSDDVFEARIPWSAIETTLRETVQPFFPFLSQSEWNSAMAAGQNTFNCMKDSQSTISFRYEYAKVLQAIKPLLPLRNPVL